MKRPIAGESLGHEVLPEGTIPRRSAASLAVTDDAPDVKGTRRYFWLTFIAVSLMCIGWACVTPVGGSPDEPQHIVKAASVARGEFVGAPTDQPAVRSVTVPRGIADMGTWTCYVFNPAAGAGCQGELASSLEPAQSTTSAGLYNPTFYILVGWPSLFIPDAVASVLAMRIVGAVLSSLFFALGVLYLRKIVGSAPATLGLGIVLTPMVVFLGGAVNPNTLEVATGFSLLCSLLAISAASGRPDARALIVVVVSGALLANDRGLSPVWMALIAVIVIASTPLARLIEMIKLPSVIVTLVGLASAVVFAAVWVLLTGTLGSMGTFAGAGETSVGEAFFTMVSRVFDPGLIGIFGWLALPAPMIVYLVWSVLIGALVILCAAVARGRALLAVVVSILGLVLIPAVTQALAVEASGYIWQGRYGLIGLAVVVVSGVIAVRRAPVPGVSLSSPIARRAYLVIAVLIVLGHAATVFNTARAYVFGTEGTSVVGFLIAGPWQPPGTVLLWLVVVSLGAATLFSAAWQRSTSTGVASPEGLVDSSPAR